MEATTQLLSTVLGSAEVVAVAGLGLDGVDTVALVTVVVVLVVVVAGCSAGFAVGPVVGSPAAGLASAGDLSALSPGTSLPFVFPAGGVAASGSTTTCGATTPAASTTPLVPKVPLAGVTNRADISAAPAGASVSNSVLSDTFSSKTSSPDRGSSLFCEKIASS